MDTLIRLLADGLVLNIFITLLLIGLTGVGAYVYFDKASNNNCDKVIAEFIVPSKNDPLNELTAPVANSMEKQQYARFLPETHPVAPAIQIVQELLLSDYLYCVVVLKDVTRILIYTVDIQLDSKDAVPINSASPDDLYLQGSIRLLM